MKHKLYLIVTTMLVLGILIFPVNGSKVNYLNTGASIGIFLDDELTDIELWESTNSNYYSTSKSQDENGFVLTSEVSPPAIVSWSNSITDDNSASVAINVSEEITLSATSDQEITSWNWYLDGAELENNYDYFSVSWDSAGTSTVTVNATNVNGTSNSITWTIIIKPPPAIISWENTKTMDSNLTFSILIYEEEEVTFNATANQTIARWNWYSDGVDQENNYDNFSESWDSAGTSTVTVNATNNNGTSNTITWTIVVIPPPAIISWSNSETDNSNTSLATNVTEDVIFNATADQEITSWNWYLDGAELENNFDNLSVSWDSAGTSTVTVNATNANGTSNTIIWTITIKPPPVIISWENTKTMDSNLTFTVLIDEGVTFDATANQTINRWNWFVEGIDQNNNLDHFTKSWDNVGVRTVSVNATNDNGTSNEIIWTVSIKSSHRPPDKGRDDTTDRGDDFGDLYVILRDENGAPILNENGCIIPLDENGNNITMIYDEDEEIYCELPEGAPVVDVKFGRLAIARSPAGVVESSFDEAINSINNALALEYDASGRFLLTKEAIDENGTTYTYQKAIDSSLENLALYKKLLQDGNLTGNLGDYDYVDSGDPASDPVLRPTLDVERFIELTTPKGGTGSTMLHLVDDETTDSDDLLRAASFLAAAADKTGHIELDMVVYLNTILGLNVKEKLKGDINGGDIEYYDFQMMDYSRKDTYSFDVLVLQEVTCRGNPYWEEKYVALYDESKNPPANAGVFKFDAAPYGNGEFYPGTSNIAGFVQAADDSLRVVHYVHTYQIPALR